MFSKKLTKFGMKLEKNSEKLQNFEFLGHFFKIRSRGALKILTSRATKVFSNKYLQLFRPQA
jgi:hypothetical protein